MCIGKQCRKGYFSQGEGVVNNVLSLVLSGVGATSSALVNKACWIGSTRILMEAVLDISK
ncbi:hypothetical protein O185_01930 [Photorhabdus temperata J3]|uniref:Uncharacterized protein n=1 Tax=Photorhabdus temperata J3 TaxID=1389415 RepID=U7R429_PHOTE|nr:hypothetical protein O185_01930 [Photorhabdus temperata J3]